MGIRAENHLSARASGHLGHMAVGQAVPHPAANFQKHAAPCRQGGVFLRQQPRMGEDIAPRLDGSPIVPSTTGSTGVSP